MFGSDGAGSAARGGQGAELAIQAAADFITDKLTLGHFELGSELAVECISAVREKIEERAKAEGLKARDFACTFLGVLSSPSGTLAMQIGDGGIVLDVGNHLELAVTPMAGEYANMTHFATDEEALKVLETRLYGVPAAQVAMFSDGLQRLALNMSTNTPHEPFFSRLFGVLSTASAVTDEELHSALVRFLDSPAVNERTDDDKTLALAILVP